LALACLVNIATRTSSPNNASKINHPSARTICSSAILTSFANMCQLFQVIIIDFFLSSGQHVYSVPDVMMFESNDLIYFHVIQPRKVSYVFKARLAQDFGDIFVSSF
jgi:hypothetical protein